MDTLTPAASSRQLKKELETAFPGVKFSVRLGRGSMCTSNCSVSRNFSEAALDAAEAQVLAAGWISRRECDVRCAARSVCHGVPIDAAAEAHHLGRKEWVRA